ncbi:MAG: cupin domain-containing protein [Thermomicrobiales bacterium]|nr:cupin domain-containing protein [Thermomicrobiales bacterium]
MDGNTALMNPVTGEQVLVTGSDRDGAFIEGISTYPPTTVEPVYHEHPHQEERLDVVSGTLLVRIEGRLQFAGPGAHVVIPAGAAHQIANSGGEPAQVVWQFEPALRTDEFLRATLAANPPARCGRWRRFVARVAIATEYSDEYRKATLPWFVQRPVLALARWIADRSVRGDLRVMLNGGKGRTPTLTRDRLGCTG